MRISRYGPMVVLVTTCLLIACRNDRVEKGQQEQTAPPAAEEPLIGSHYLLFDLGGVTYDLTLGDQAFLVRDGSGEEVYSGSVASVGTGFRKLLVTDSLIPALRPTGFEMYATELPVGLLFLSFASSWIPGAGYERGVVGINTEGACPLGPVDYNLITTPDEHFDQVNFRAFGAAVIQETAGASSFQMDGSGYLLRDDFNASTSTTPAIAGGGFTCGAGSGFLDNGTDRIFLTASGLALAGLQGVGVFLLLPRPDAHPETVAAAGRTYRGIRQRLFDTQSPDQGNGGLIRTSEPIRAWGEGAGTLTVQVFDGFESSTSAAGALTAQLAQNAGTQQRPGLFDGSTLDGAPFRVIVHAVNGKFILLGMYQWDFDGQGGAGTAAPDWVFVVLAEE